jgi:hypothetical protein
LSAVRRLVVAAGAAWVATLAPAAAPPAATASPTPAEHRAVVVVDTGTSVKTVCVRFREESLTGIEALTRASVDPVLRAFPGKGAAVCSLCGTGCPGDDSCLTCDSGGRFWSYSRAPAGAGALRTSGVGASATTVRDGDVEGWRWGRGGTPPFVSVEQVCGEVAPAAATSTTAAPVATTTAPTPGATGAPAPAAAPPPRPRATVAPATPGTGAVAAGPAPEDAAPTPPAPEPGPVTEGGRDTTAPSATDQALAGSRDAEGGGSGGAGLVVFAAVLAGLTAWAVTARQRRRRVR